MYTRKKGKYAILKYIGEIGAASNGFLLWFDPKVFAEIGHHLLLNDNTIQSYVKFILHLI